MEGTRPSGAFMIKVPWHPRRREADGWCEKRIRVENGERRGQPRRSCACLGNDLENSRKARKAHPTSVLTNPASQVYGLSPCGPRSPLRAARTFTNSGGILGHQANNTKQMEEDRIQPNPRTSNTNIVTICFEVRECNSK